MFSRFDSAAKRVLRAAEQACRTHNHYYVGVGHLLLALLEERDAGIERCLAARGTDAAEVLADVRRALGTGTGDDGLWDGILVTPRVLGIVTRAESAVPADDPIGPADIFDAMAAEGTGLAAEILGRYQGNQPKPRRAAG